MDPEVKSLELNTQLNNSSHEGKIVGSWDLNFISGHESWNSDVYKLLVRFYALPFSTFAM